MKLALLQLELDPRSRSRNVQTILASIREAARQQPAPDLIVLPGGCDSGGTAPQRDASAAALRAVREGIALQAREWGVYIAAGLHRREATGYEPYTALFDRDGDLVLGCPAENDRSTSGWLCVHMSDAGDLGCFDAQRATGLPEVVEVSSREALIVACVPPTSGVRERRLVESRLSALPVPSSGGSLHWAVVNAAGEERTGAEFGTCLIGPDGERACSAASAGVHLILAEVDVRPAPQQERVAFLRGEA